MLRVYFQIFKKLYHFANIYSILQSIYIYIYIYMYVCVCVCVCVCVWDHVCENPAKVIFWWFTVFYIISSFIRLRTFCENVILTYLLLTE